MSFLKTWFYFWNFYLVLFYAFNFFVLLLFYYLQTYFPLSFYFRLASLTFFCANSKCIELFLFIVFFLLWKHTFYEFFVYSILLDHSMNLWLLLWRLCNLVLLRQKMFLLLEFLLLLFFCSFLVERQLQTLSFQQQLKFQFSYFSFSWTFWESICK